MKPITVTFVSNHKLTPEKNHFMILTAIIEKTIKAKLDMPRTNEGFYRKSFNMHAAISANEHGYFTPEFEHLDEWEEQNTALNRALNALKKKLPGASKRRNAACEKLKIIHRLALIFVNNIVLVDQPRALLVIEAALMAPVKIGKRNKPEFEVKQTKVEGSIKLTTLAARKNGRLVHAAYEWEYSTDGGKTWDRLLITLVSTTIAAGMKTGKITVFRRRITTKSGTGEWLISKEITPA